MHVDPGFARWCLKRAVRLNDVARLEEQTGAQEKLVGVYVYRTVSGMRSAGITLVNMWQRGEEPKYCEIGATALEHGASLNTRHPILLKALGLETQLQPLTPWVDMYDFLLEEWVPLPRGEMRLRPGEGVVLKRQDVDAARNLHIYIERILPNCLRGRNTHWAGEGDGARRGWPQWESGWTEGSMVNLTGSATDVEVEMT